MLPVMFSTRGEKNGEKVLDNPYNLIYISNAM